MIRLFVGLALPPEITGQLTPLASGIPGARWVDEHNLHVTLRFVGEIDEGAAHDLHDALTAVEAQSFDLAIEGLGVFGGRRPHRLWAGIAAEPLLDRLQGRIEAAAIRAGLAPEPRKFTPHVTLARLKNSPVQRIGEFISGNSPLRAGPARVSHFTLFRSHLSRNGAEYEAVAEYPLVTAGGEAAGGSR